MVILDFERVTLERKFHSGDVPTRYYYHFYCSMRFDDLSWLSVGEIIDNINHTCKKVCFQTKRKPTILQIIKNCQKYM